MAFLNEENEIKNEAIKINRLRNEKRKILDVSEKTIERELNCCSYIEVAVTNTFEKKVTRAFSCGSRFCPICAKTKARKRAIEIASIASYLREEKKKSFLFVTLTVPNCKVEKYEETKKRINASVSKLFKRKDYQIFKDYIIKFETTFNNQTKEFHPHCHILIAVDENYFQDGYITQEKLSKDWKSSYKSRKNLIVDIRVFKNDDDQKSPVKAFFEMAKYEAKNAEYVKNQAAFVELMRVLNRSQDLRFCGEFSRLRGVFKKDEYGVFKQYREELEDEIDLEQIEFIVRARWQINQKKYDEKIVEFNEQEKQKIIKREKKQLDEKELEYQLKLINQKIEQIKREPRNADKKFSKLKKEKENILKLFDISKKKKL